MNGLTSLAPAELILEVAPGDPDWAAHFLTGFEQWLIEGGFSAGSIRQHYLRCAKWLVTLTLPPRPEETPGVLGPGTPEAPPTGTQGDVVFTVVLIVLLGVFPRPLLTLVDGSVKTLQRVSAPGAAAAVARPAGQDSFKRLAIHELPAPREEAAR